MNLLRIILLFVILSPAISLSSPLTKDTTAEIDHLLQFISTSPCKFMRNGKWYAASEAANHIRKKYEYVLGKGLVNSSEDFIQYSATKSSISGKAYIVRCGVEPEISSAAWLHRELTVYRTHSEQ